MKRNYQIDKTAQVNVQDLIKQIAFHEAGHAAAIYLCNKQKQLPSLSFQISQTFDSLFTLADSVVDNYFVASVEGGYLIDNVPHAVIESAEYFTEGSADAYQMAFEADMINLLVGALAEAKYVSLREGSAFDEQTADMSLWQFYGGTSDWVKVHDYLEHFIACRQHREKTMLELLVKASAFVSNDHNWQAIERLALYILNCKASIISCEEAIEVLDNA